MVSSSFVGGSQVSGHASASGYIVAGVALVEMPVQLHLQTTHNHCSHVCWVYVEGGLIPTADQNCPPVLMLGVCRRGTDSYSRPKLSPLYLCWVYVEGGLIPTADQNCPPVLMLGVCRRGTDSYSRPKLSPCTYVGCM